MKLVIVLTVLILSAAVTCAQDTNEGRCRYAYTRQPPDEAFCNPYLNGELRLECSVSGPLQSTIRIVWFRSLGTDSCHIQQVEERPNVVVLQQQQFFSDRRVARSLLRVRNLDDADSGAYWCRILANETELLTPSDPLALEVSAAYANLPPCSTTAGLSKMEHKCANTSLLEPSYSCYTTTSHVESTTILPTRTLSTSGILTQSMTYFTVSVSTTPLTPVTESNTASPVENADSQSSNATMSESSDSYIKWELCIALVIMVLCAVLIAILLFVIIYLCLKDGGRKRQAPSISNSYTTSPRTTDCYSSGDFTVTVPQDYEVPWSGLTHSYESVLTVSHEYEDIIDMDENKAYTGPQVQTKHNQAYRAFTVVPNPTFEFY